MRDHFIARLTELADRDPRIVLITGDLGFGVLTDFAKRFPKQFINAGVAEQNMTGIAAGLALEGRVVFTYSIANFVFMRCLEQIRNDAAYHDANVNVVSIGAGFSYGALGISHHATEDLSIMRCLPGLTVASPGDDWEAAEATEALANTAGTSYLRLDKSSAGHTQRPGETFQLGRARVLRDGHDLTLVGTGGILECVLQAADTLAQRGIRCRVVSVHTIHPLDVETLARAAEETGGLITIEEHTVQGGLGGAVAEVLMEKGTIPQVFQRMGLRSEFSSVVGSQQFLRKRYELDANAIVATAERTLARRAPQRRAG